MGLGVFAAAADAFQTGHIADGRRGEDDVFALGQVLGKVDFLQSLLFTQRDEAFVLRGVARPHLALDIAAKTADRRRGQDGLG